MAVLQRGWSLDNNFVKGWKITNLWGGKWASLEILEILLSWLD